MACDERWLEILSAWQDGEATVMEIAQLRTHLPGCVRCEQAREAFERIHRAFGELRGDAVPAWVSAPARPALARPRRARARSRWPVLAAGALVAAAAVALVWGPVHRHGSPLADELEARHLTAFARASPCEFTSSDPAAVRAWIASHLGYDVEIPAISGAILLGARRCTVHGGMTASLLYRRGDEPLTLFLPRVGSPVENEAARMSRLRSGCTVGRLGAHVCARPGLFAVAETQGTALTALESF